VSGFVFDLFHYTSASHSQLFGTLGHLYIYEFWAGREEWGSYMQGGP
jgi:hypothetical protein